MTLRWLAAQKRIQALGRENERLRREVEEPRRDGETLEREAERLQKEAERLEREKERLWRERNHLKEELETARRAAKRQAAPFSNGEPKRNPKRPGRKAGPEYEPRAPRAICVEVDEEIPVRPAGRPGVYCELDNERRRRGTLGGCG